MTRPTPLTYDILLALADSDRHGYGIIKEIEHRGAGAPSTGAMYLALRRMHDEGLIEESDGGTDGGTDGANDDRRRYYRLTGAGREVAEMESMRLAGLVSAARSKKLLGTAGGDA